MVGNTNLGLTELLGGVNEHRKHLVVYSSSTIIMILIDSSIEKIKDNLEGPVLG